MALSIVVFAVAAPVELEFSHPIDRAETVLKALSQKVGISLRPSGVLGDDRIYINLHDTDWETAKPKLAEALGAEWRKSGNILYLHRPKAEVADDKAEAIESFRKWQKAIKIESDYSFNTLVRKLSFKETDKVGSSNQRFGSREGFDSSVSLSNIEKPLENVNVMSPAARALLKIVPLLDADAIGRQMDQPTTIASTTPKANDFKLPASARSVLKQYWADRAVAFRALEATTKQGGYWYFDSLQGMQAPPPEDQEPLVILNVSEQRLQLELACIIDDKLTQLGTVSIWLGDRGAPSEAVERADFKKLTSPLVLTRDQRAVGKFIEGSYRWDEDDVSEEDLARARQLLKDPVTNDPLQIICQPVIEQAAEAMGVNVIALFSDSATSHAHWIDQDDPTVGDALTQMVNHIWSAKVDESDGYLLITPRDFAATEKSRFDREAARDFIQEIEQNNEVSLNALIRLHKRAGDPDRFRQLSAYASTALDLNESYSDSEMIGLLAALAPPQLSAAKSRGYRMLARNLPLKVQTYVLESVTQTYDTISDQPPDESQLSNSYGMRYLLGAPPNYNETEPKTVQTLLALRNGVPSGVVVTIRIYRRPTIKFKPKEEDNRYGGMWGESMDLTDVAQRLYWESKTKPEDIGDYKLDMDNLSVGYTESAAVVLEIPGLGYTYIQDSLPTGVAKYTYKPYDKLPRSIRSEIEMMMNKLSEKEGG